MGKPSSCCGYRRGGVRTSPRRPRARVTARPAPWLSVERVPRRGWSPASPRSSVTGGDEERSQDGCQLQIEHRIGQSLRGVGGQEQQARQRNDHKVGPRDRKEPGFPFCQPDQGLYTPTRLSARQISSAHVIPLPTPVRWGRARRETDWSPCFQGISQAPLHTCALSSPLRCTQAARQPPGTGSAQILRSMSPNSRRVRCPSASRSQ